MTNNSAYSLFAQNYSSNYTSINMREEFDKLINGGGNSPVRGQQMLIWEADITRKVEDFKQYSETFPEASRTSERLQSDYVHTESLVRGWVGYTGGSEDTVALRKWNANTAFFYLEHDVFDSIKIAELSEVWTLVLDSDGDVTYDTEGNYVRDIRWNIRQAIPFREINGRIEFWRLHCERQEIT